MRTRDKIAAAVAALGLAALAGAGQYAPQPVTIDLTNRTASGDMITARFDPKEVVMIGCGVRTFDDGAGGATTFGFCQARDAEETQAFCNSANAELLDVMKATADFSYVTFSWNEDGECTRIGFSTQSFYIPSVLAP